MNLTTKLLVLIVLGWVTCPTLAQQTETRPANQDVPAKSADNHPIPVEDYELVWSEEFDGDSVDPAKWTFETGDGGWGNREWQNYTDGRNATVGDGTLKITARKTGPGQNLGDYTSTRLNSKRAFQYGRFEIRAKMPKHKGNGAWPAIWMLGEGLRDRKFGWPDCGEIDIMEYVSYTPDTVYFNFHSKTNNHSIGTNISSGPIKLDSIEEEFHNYGVLWDETKLQVYLDTVDNVQLTFDRPEDFNQSNWPFDKPFYFLLNVAVGGNWGGQEGVDDSIFPATMEIDYVRVYQPKKK
jgi:beta-glucanase (GH16 family)